MMILTKIKKKTTAIHIAAASTNHVLKANNNLKNKSIHDAKVSISYNREKRFFLFLSGKFPKPSGDFPLQHGLHAIKREVSSKTVVLLLTSLCLLFRRT